jgi:cytidylate kinase
MRPLIIAIDGPSGAGKSTLGRRLARELGLLYVDTGAMYRAVALTAVQSNVSAHDAEGLTEIARRTRIELTGDPDHLQIKLDGRDVTAEIRTEQASRLASVISTVAGVRRELVGRQREMGTTGAGIVLDGRDIGTVVFPRADVKFFITARPEERARRRYEQDHAKAPDLTYDETLADLNARDQRDSTRDDSPLRIAADAIVIDTTGLSIEEVFARMLEVVRERQANGNKE